MSLLKDSLVAHYKMNDNAASTVVVDSQAYSNGTAQQNTSVLHTAGKVGGALTHNATSDYVDTNNLFLTTFQADFSISMWVKPTDGVLPIVGIADLLGIFSDTPATKDICLIMQTAAYSAGGAKSEVVFQYSIGATIATVCDYGPVFSDGQETWHHIAVNCVQTSAVLITLSLYFDGVFKKSTTLANELMTSWKSPDNTVFIGQGCHIGVADAGFYFGGDIDNVMIFSKALTQEEVTFLFNGGYGTEGLDLSNYILLESWNLDWSF